MYHSTLTEKGQTTIPAAAREALGMKAGDKLVYDVQGESLVVRKHKGVMASKGALAHKISKKMRSVPFAKVREQAAKNMVKHKRYETLPR